MWSFTLPLENAVINWPHFQYMLGLTQLLASSKNRLLHVMDEVLVGGINLCLTLGQPFPLQTMTTAIILELFTKTESTYMTKIILSRSTQQPHLGTVGYHPQLVSEITPGQYHGKMQFFYLVVEIMGQVFKSLTLLKERGQS